MKRRKSEKVTGSERARISYFVAHTATTCVVLLEENHMQLMEPQLPTGYPGKPRNLQFSVCKAWRDCSLKMSKMLKVLKVLK